MFESFRVTFSQTLVLFTFIAIGYGFKKSGKVSKDFNKGLSNLLVYTFLPFLTFGSMADNFKLEVLADKAKLILISTGILCGFIILAFVFSRVFAKNKMTRDIYLYSFTFPNSGYIGNPLVLAIFGELMLFDFVVFCIPFFIVTYTFGVYILNPNRSFSFKNLINPILVSLLLGMLVGVLNIKLPTVAETIIDTGANCMAPAAMILTGIVFASNDLKRMVSNLRVYIACTIKMVLIPMIAVLIIVAAKVPENVAILVITMLSLPTGLNSIVFPEAYGGDSQTGAQLCFTSTLTCLIFIPVIFALYHFLCGVIY